MASEFRRLRRVEFADTDAAGIIHFAAYFRYMEETEHEFLRSLGLSVNFEAGGTRFGFPRLAARCDFLRPLHFEDVVEIHLRVLRKGLSSLTYQFLFSHAGEAVALGEVSTLSCRVGPGGHLESVPLPGPMAEAIDESRHAPLEFGPRRRSQPGGDAGAEAGRR
jgi:acyl-CoA thioester hydrolase